MSPEGGSTEVKISVIGAGFKLTPISQDHRIYHYKLNLTKSEFTKCQQFNRFVIVKQTGPMFQNSIKNVENGMISVPKPSSMVHSRHY